MTLLQVILFFGTLASALAQEEFVQTLTPCTSAANADMGYVNISAMNADMMAESTKIGNGKTPETAYEFLLCPNTNFVDFDTPLTPVLSNITFTCGPNGERTRLCRFVGGGPQVTINLGAVAGYPITDVKFVGVTFTDFSVASVLGSADSQTTVTLDNCIFRGFFGTAVQQRLSGAKPFNVDFVDSDIQEGSGTFLFLNRGGDLVLRNASIVDATVQSAVSTLSTGPFLGSTSLNSVEVSNSDISIIFATASDASTTALDVTVFGMQDFDIIFSASGSGSDVSVTGLMVRNNFNQATGVEWIGVNADLGSFASVSSSSVMSSTNALHVVSATRGATIVVSELELVGVKGGQQLNSGSLSAVVHASEFSNVTADAVVGREVEFFAAFFFVEKNSTMRTTFFCGISGDVQAVAYVDETGSIESSNNFVDFTAVNLEVCGGEAQGLVQEDVNSTCFEPDPVCRTTCGAFLNSTVCRSIETEAPTPAPTRPPSPGGVPVGPTPPAGGGSGTKATSLLVTGVLLITLILIR